jgi:zeaxanthin glucosyltransferase
MATLVFCIFTFQGELNGSLHLAKQLQGMGHQIYYLGLADSREQVQSHEFEFITILENIFPLGFFKQLDSSQFNQMSLFLRRINFIKTINQLIHSLIQQENKEIHSVFKNINPDLLILSTTEGAYATFLGLIAHECQIKSIYLTDMFPSLPTHQSICGQARKHSMIQWFSWQNFQDFIDINISSKIYKKVMAFLGLDIDYKKAIYQLADKAGVSSRNIDLSRNAPLMLPHLFLCPKEFDLPDIVREDCFYAEPSIDLSREKGSDFCWNTLDKNKKLIYCSLGTTLGTFETLRIRGTNNFFQSIIDCISLLMDEYQVVIAISSFVDLKKLNNMSQSVDIVIQDKLPQLKILERSSMAIIAGGIHTVKECIFFGVPMIVFPVWADQFENAERVSYHGLGLVGNAEEVSSTYLKKLIFSLENGSNIHENMGLWKQKFREIEASNRATQYIQKILEARV